MGAYMRQWRLTISDGHLQILDIHTQRSGKGLTQLLPICPKLLKSAEGDTPVSAWAVAGYVLPETISLLLGQ